MRKIYHSHIIIWMTFSGRMLTSVDMTLILQLNFHYRLCLLYEDYLSHNVAHFTSNDSNTVW